LQFVVYGGYCIAVGLLFLSIAVVSHIVNGCNQGWLQRLSEESVWKKAKHGEEEDCESRQLSLGGAIEATK